MTDTTTTKAASNSGTAKKHTPTQREHGMTRLRENECYQLTSLIGDCLTEAEHLIRKVHGKAQDRVLDYDGSRGTSPLDLDDARKILNEAYECASLALTYIFSASTHMRDDSDEGEPPF